MNQNLFHHSSGAPDGFVVVFGLIIAIIVVSIAYAVFKKAAEYAQNSQEPLTVIPTVVVAKRSESSQQCHTHDQHHHHSSSTDYFVTFELEGGARMELSVSASQYGLLVEGDEGSLTHQGTWFKGFERGISTSPPKLEPTDAGLTT
jgi:hypothetical protein